MNWAMSYWMLVGGLTAYGFSIESGDLKLKMVLIIAGSCGGMICYRWIIKKMLNGLAKFSGGELLARGIGIIFGLLVSLSMIWLGQPMLELLALPQRMAIILLLVLGAVGISGMISGSKLLKISISGGIQFEKNKSQQNLGNQFKILDTSAIIDGRIADLCQTGFVEGTLVVPNFILAELQKIADSADALRRNRGRRGLDLLNKIQKEQQIAVKIFDRDYDEIDKVDTKLLKLAREMEAKVVTNDFNLNKVAELYGVQVLNINELSNAIKPLVLPGEEMLVHVLREGKEHDQGIGYLDDGTMIVIEGGRNYIGVDVGILVTSVLQTSAGRMIFAKPKGYQGIQNVTVAN